MASISPSRHSAPTFGAVHVRLHGDAERIAQLGQSDLARTAIAAELIRQIAVMRAVTMRSGMMPKPLQTELMGGQCLKLEHRQIEPAPVVRDARHPFREQAVDLGMELCLLTGEADERLEVEAIAAAAPVGAQKRGRDRLVARPGREAAVRHFLCRIDDGFDIEGDDMLGGMIVARAIRLMSHVDDLSSVATEKEDEFKTLFPFPFPVTPLALAGSAALPALAICRLAGRLFRSSSQTGRSMGYPHARPGAAHAVLASAA